MVIEERRKLGILTRDSAQINLINLRIKGFSFRDFTTSLVKKMERPDFTTLLVKKDRRTNAFV